MSHATLHWDDVRERASRGVGISWEEARAIVAIEDADGLEQLFAVAGTVRRQWKGNFVNTCGISNAKSGRCAEACSFCSQSAHYTTDAPKYVMKSAEELADEARQAWESGVREFSLVASGRAMTNPKEIATLKVALEKIRAETGMQTCASLGLMSKEGLAELKDAGLQSFHHNLETARSFHASIVQTHSYDDEVEAVKNAKSLGMYVCSGGILGMGETWEQRIELAMDLRDLDVDSVPINFLNPRPGTPMQDTHELTEIDCLKVIALYRLVLPTKDLIVCGGRAVNLKDRQADIFEAGANGVMLGNYLTTAGRPADADLEMMEARGMVIRPPPHQPLPPSVRPGVRSPGTDANGVAP